MALGVTVAACGGDDSEGSSGGSGGSIDLVAYSTPQQAFEEGIIPAFQETSFSNGRPTTEDSPTTEELHAA